MNYYYNKKTTSKLIFKIHDIIELAPKKYYIYILYIKKGVVFILLSELICVIIYLFIYLFTDITNFFFDWFDAVLYNNKKI